MVEPHEDDSWMLLRSYAQRSFAEMDLARLDEDRIEARLESDDAGGAFPSLAFRGVRLYVRMRHKGRALASLDMDDDEIEC